MAKIKNKPEKGEALSIEDFRRIFANPFYCINISEDLFGDHEQMITEEMWIRVAVKEIKDIGPEKFLENLLENLRGNFVQ